MRELSALIDELELLGVRLWEDGGQLRFRAPRGVMTDELRARVREHKQALLQHLRSDVPVLVADPGSAGEPFPLTDVQLAYLLGRRDAFGFGGVACHAYLEAEFPDLDPERLQAAWRVLVARHDMLRAVVHPDGHQQVLAEVPEYEIAVADVRSDPDGFGGAIERTRAELDHRVHPSDQWPLFDLRLTRGAQRTVLHLSIDLMIADYASVQLLLAELDRVYQAPGEPLPEIGIGFRDYVVAARGLVGGPAHDRDRAYWDARIDELPPAPELPTLADIGPGSGTAEGDPPPRFRRRMAALDEAAWAALRERATAAALSPTSVLLAAYAETIGRWSRNPRFSLNLTLMQRMPLHPDVDALVGDFTSVTLLGVEQDRAATFRERAGAVAAQLFADMDHRTFSGIEVIREIARRKGRRAALMPVVFTSTLGLDATAVEQGALTGQGELVHGITQTPQVWLDCQVIEHHGRLQISWDVRDGVLPDDVVDTMFAAYVDLVRALAADVGTWESTSPIPLPAAQARRRAEVNDTAAELPVRLLHEGFFAQARRFPEHTAVVTTSGSWTYGDIAAAARGVAAAVRAAGRGRGGIVAVVTEKGPEQVAALLGTLLAGCAYLPVDAGQPAARRAVLLTDAGADVVLTQSWLQLDELPDGTRVIAVDRLVPVADPAAVEPVAVESDDLAYVIYTSGSTGTPKGVMISHRAAVNTVEDINSRFGVGPLDRVLGLAQLGFDLSVYDVFGTLAAGATLVLPDPGRRGDPSHWARVCASAGVTIWNSVPAQLQMLDVYLASDPHELPSLRLAMLSGDWIPVPLPDRIRAKLPALELVSLGGATEAAIWSIGWPIGEVPAGARSIPYGLPLANQTFHVLDAAMRPVPDLVTGELYIGGAGLALGYLGDPDRTAERFVVDPEGRRLYRTGDLGRYRPDGVIEFLGREDDQIKIRGHRIELAEIEAALAAPPAVDGAAVVVDDNPDADRTTRGLDRRLAGFVSTARTGNGSDGFGAELSEVAVAAGAAATRDLDRSVIVSFSRMLDEVCLLSMAHTFRRVGLFQREGARHGIEEILEVAQVARPHRRQVRRWLATLAENGMVERDAATGAYHSLVPTDDVSVAAAWQATEEVQAGLVYPDELMRYFRVCAEHLPELLRDDQGPMQLMFPDGTLETAEAAYRNNLYARYLNQAVIACFELMLDRHPGGRPLRVLEIGAGVGGTSNDLIPALAARVEAGAQVEYRFTDISHFFLNEARERFAHLPWVSYGLFDVDVPFRDQGLAANSFDVIVAANVMHNALHVGRALDQFRELLTPGGSFVMLESTKEHHEVMVSMEFMMEFDEERPDFEDVRAGQERVFVLREEWLEQLARAGGEPAVVLPDPADELSLLGQNLFVTRFKTDRAAVGVDELRTHLAQRLPDHMLPAHLEVVDALPLTGSGKVDRQRLASWLPAARSARASGSAAPRTDTERLVAGLWEQVLGTTGVGREDDFFQIGGDSLLVAQLVGELRTRLPQAAELDWDGLLRHMLNQPTVAALAAHLDAGAGRGTSAIVPMGGGSDGLLDPDVPVRVLVHEGLGSIAPYRSVAAQLAGDGPVLGLAIGSVERYLARDPGTLIADLAAEYAEQLGARHRRFHVVGYCMGGLLATELARRLTAGGAEVQSLSIISSYRIPPVEDELVLQYCYLRVMGVDPAELGFPADEGAISRALRAVVAANGGRVPPGAMAALDDPGLDDPGLAAVAATFARLADLDGDERVKAVTAAVGAARGAGAELPADVVSPYAVFRHAFAATAQHEPVPYDGDITFLRQHGRNHFLPELAADMTAFWADVCAGELRVHDVPGDHFTCMQPPNAGRVAEIVGGAR